MANVNLLTSSLVICLLVACAPSAQAIQTAIAQTQAAIPTATFIPSTVSGATTTNMFPTVTTGATQPNYILEQGICVNMVGKISGNPSGQPGCGVEKRTQVYMDPKDTYTVSLSNNPGDREIFCSLYSLDGTYIMSDLDTNGNNKVTCHP